MHVPPEGGVRAARSTSGHAAATEMVVGAVRIVLPEVGWEQDESIGGDRDKIRSPTIDLNEQADATCVVPCLCRLYGIISAPLCGL